MSALQPGAPLETVTLDDARALPFAHDSADAVLLFGPLYHLVKRWDRLAVPREARRTLRPGGVLFAASRDRFASAGEIVVLAFNHYQVKVFYTAISF